MVQTRTIGLVRFETSVSPYRKLDLNGTCLPAVSTPVSRGHAAGSPEQSLPHNITTILASPSLLGCARHRVLRLNPGIPDAVTSAGPNGMTGSSRYTGTARSFLSDATPLFHPLSSALKRSIGKGSSVNRTAVVGSRCRAGPAGDAFPGYGGLYGR